MFFLYLFLGSQSGQDAQGQGQGQGQGPTQKVTWSDFYYNMLSKGEVQEVTVFPNVNRCRIVLRPDAIYKVKFSYLAENLVFRK